RVGPARSRPSRLPFVVRHSIRAMPEEAPQPPVRSRADRIADTLERLSRDVGFGSGERGLPQPGHVALAVLEVGEGAHPRDLGARLHRGATARLHLLQRLVDRRDPARDDRGRRVTGPPHETAVDGAGFGRLLCRLVDGGGRGRRVHVAATHVHLGQVPIEGGAVELTGPGRVVDRDLEVHHLVHAFLLPEATRASPKASLQPSAYCRKRGGRAGGAPGKRRGQLALRAQNARTGYPSLPEVVPLPRFLIDRNFSKITEDELAG